MNSESCFLHGPFTGQCQPCEEKNLQTKLEKHLKKPVHICKSDPGEAPSCDCHFEEAEFKNDEVYKKGASDMLAAMIRSSVEQSKKEHTCEFDCVGCLHAGFNACRTAFTRKGEEFLETL